MKRLMKQSRAEKAEPVAQHIIVYEFPPVLMNPE